MSPSFIIITGPTFLFSPFSLSSRCFSVSLSLEQRHYRAPLSSLLSAKPPHRSSLLHLPTWLSEFYSRSSETITFPLNSFFFHSQISLSFTQILPSIVICLVGYITSRLIFPLTKFFFGFYLIIKFLCYFLYCLSLLNFIFFIVIY